MKLETTPFLAYALAHPNMEDSKIIQDDDKLLVVKAVITSKIVHKYKDAMAYKPADELEKAAWTVEGIDG